MQADRFGIDLLRGLVLGAFPTWAAEVESGAAPDFALQARFSAHGRDQLRGDGQSQAGSPVAACGRAVGLLEHIEDRRVLFGRDADARIAHREMESYLILGARLASDFDDDLAALGELDRVIDEVHHHLPHPAIVAHEPCGDVAMDIAGQFQPLLMGAQGERLHRIAQAFAEVEPLAFQHELFRLDLGKIEDVVDHREQRLARIADGGEVFALLGTELALEDQFGRR